ncbi:MAG: carbohydrate porin [Acidocella sp.]|nr:carbohydrate porin [Acidocella sp.]
MRHRTQAYWGLGITLALCAGTAQAQSDNTGLLGNIGGLRPALATHGITLGITDSETLLGNTTGGVKQGATLQGLTTATLDADLSKLISLPGGSFHISALQIHGRSLSEYYLDNLQQANGNEADNATRLWEMWYDQALGNSGVDVKIGQQSIDNEFMVSDNSGLFVNTMAGWPLLPSVDMYSGGPAYPLSSLGVRLQYAAPHHLTLLTGVFDDNPSGGSFNDDTQEMDGNGALFNLNTGALFITELQYAPPASNGTYKLGFWYDTGRFPDQYYGDASMHRGNYSIYAVVDQTLWQFSPTRSLNGFARLMGGPAAQNLISFSFNGGLTLSDPLPGRPNDSVGIDFGVGKVSGRAADADRASGAPARNTETLIELTYQAQITPWLQLQPDLQYIANPGGGIMDPANPTHRLGNEFIAGLRANTTF